MSHFYGVLTGSRGQATRCGTKNSGLNTTAAGWKGAIEVYLTEVNGVDHYAIYLTPNSMVRRCSRGEFKLIAEGILDSNVGRRIRHEHDYEHAD